MKDMIFYRLAAIAAILSGVCLIAGKGFMILGGGQIGEILDFFSPFFGLFALTGIYTRYMKKVGWFGLIAFITFFAGMCLVMCLDYFGAFILSQLPVGTANELFEGPMGPVFAVCGMVFVIGDLMFGIILLRTAIFSRLFTLFVMTGFITIPMAEVFSEKMIIGGSFLAGLGLCGWGHDLLRA